MLCLGGILIQIPGISVNFAAYISRHHNQYYNFESKGYDPDFFPVAGHLHDTIRYIRELPEQLKHPGNNLYELRDMEVINFAGTLDFWWLHLLTINGLSRIRIIFVLLLNFLIFLFLVLSLKRMLKLAVSQN